MSEQILPAIRYINGHPYIKVRDLADAWYTTTSHILRTGKSTQVPAKYRKTIDGCTWCDVEGLRYRLDMMKRGGKIPEQLRQFVDRFPENEKHVDDGLGPQVETVRMKNGSTGTLTRCYLQRIDYPSQKEIKVALDNKQVLWRYKNKRIQVLAQTLSSFLNTRTSSLLAVNKKQGVPGKFIHRQWKVTWVDLEGLKVRVNHTEHESALLKGLKQVIGNLDEYKAAYKRPPIVEANKRAVRNTERINNLDVRAKALEHDVPQLLHAGCPLKERVDRFEKQATQVTVDQTLLEKVNGRIDAVVTLFDGFRSRLDGLSNRVEGLDNNMQRRDDAVYALKKRVERVEKHVDDIEAADKKAAHAMAEGKTPLDALAKRVSGIVTHADRLDTQTEGLVSRISVVEDTSKWLSWTLAGVIGLRFLGLMLRWLRRK